MSIARLAETIRGSAMRLLRANPRLRATNAAPIIEAVGPIEEERSPFYDPSTFYPARLGDILDERYELATKLGHGSRSTVWLARDLFRSRFRGDTYVTVKIGAARAADAFPVDNAPALGRLVLNANVRHEGWHFVRHVINSFEIDRRHKCLVYEPMREPLSLYCLRYKGGRILPVLVKIMTQMILHGLDYLHTECRLTHTDLKPDNVMVKLEDFGLLSQSAQDEYDHPLPQRQYHDGRVIYLSRNDYGPPRGTTGVVRIADLDLARDGSSLQYGCIQAELYRAPEVMFDAGFSYSADVWSLGVMLWELLEGKSLFGQPYRSDTDEHDENVHLEQMVALLGPRPQGLFASGRRASLFTSEQVSPDYPVIPNREKSTTSDAQHLESFSASVKSMEGEDKELFIAFASRMLKWDPSDRSTAKELLRDPWLVV